MMPSAVRIISSIFSSPRADSIFGDQLDEGILALCERGSLNKALDLLHIGLATDKRERDIIDVLLDRPVDIGDVLLREEGKGIIDTRQREVRLRP